MNRIILVGICIALVCPAMAGAQGSAATPVAEFAVGHAAFADDATIHHVTFGGSLRWYLTPRLSAGPELVYLRGPGSDRDLTLTGNVTFDLLSPRPGRRWTP